MKLNPPITILAILAASFTWMAHRYDPPMLGTLTDAIEVRGQGYLIYTREDGTTFRTKTADPEAAKRQIWQRGYWLCEGDTKVPVIVYGGMKTLECPQWGVMNLLLPGDDEEPKP